MSKSKGETCPFSDADIREALRKAGGPITSRQLAATLVGQGRPVEPWVWWRIAGVLERLASGRPDHAMPVIAFFYQGGWWYVHPDHADRATLSGARPSQEPLHALRDYWELGRRQERRGRGAAHHPRAQ